MHRGDWGARVVGISFSRPLGSSPPTPARTDPPLCGRSRRGGEAFQRWGRRAPAFQRLGRAGKEEGPGVPCRGSVLCPRPQLITVSQQGQRRRRKDGRKQRWKDQDESEGGIMKKKEEEVELVMRRKKMEGGK